MADSTYRMVELQDMGDSAEGRPRQPPPPYASSASSMRSDGFEKPRKTRTWRANLTREKLLNNAKEVTTNAGPLIRAATSKALPKIKTGIRTRAFRRHAGGILVLFIFGFLPLTVYFNVVSHPFVAKPVSCGSVEEEAPGIAGLFTIDRVSGNFPFWLAKLLDTIWDLFVARGMQFLAGWISYTVFSSALLRAIEASPIPYRTFIGISMNGASVLTVVSMLADLGRYSRKRTIWLFAYGALAMTYVLAMPTLFSTMTGYVSAASPYIKVPDTSLFVPADAFMSGTAFYGLPGVDDGTCVLSTSLQLAEGRNYTQSYRCNSTCATNYPNGTSYNLLTGKRMYGYYHNSYLYPELLDTDICPRFRNETYPERVYDDPTSEYLSDYHLETFNCNDTISLTIASQNFTWNTAMSHTQSSSAYLTRCYNNTGYPTSLLDANSRCLPDGDSAYQWGFSSLLTSIVLVVHGVWALSVYAIWADAELHSELVRAHGYRLTQLRGAFAVAAAAERSTGLRGVELRGERGVEGRLGGRGAVVEVGVFGEAVAGRGEEGPSP